MDDREGPSVTITVFVGTWQLADSVQGKLIEGQLDLGDTVTTLMQLGQHGHACIDGGKALLPDPGCKGLRDSRCTSLC